MKKIFFVGLMVIASISGVLAADVATPSSYGQILSDVQAVYSGNETLTNVDTAVIFDKEANQGGYTYAVQLTAGSMASGDSVKFECLVYGSNGTTLVQQTTLDTLANTETAIIFALPVNITSFGSKFTVRAINMKTSTAAVMVRAELLKLRTVQYNKSLIF